MVNIYLKVAGEDDRWVPILAIPHEDIERLCPRRPLKWLRFVAFTVVGAYGNLFAAPGGDIVNYENVSLENIPANSNYHFAPNPGTRYCFADPLVLNDRVTSSSLTPRRDCLQADVARRDGDCCVITGADSKESEAAHVVPHSKGDQGIHDIVSRRAHLYPDVPTMGINSVQNAMLLATHLHKRLRSGRSAFIKTPNFALDCDDIPTVEIDAVPAYRVTMQHIEPYTARPYLPQYDVQADWSNESAPPNILLDYMYAAAAISRWGSNEIQTLLNAYYGRGSSTVAPVPADNSDLDNSADYERDSDDTAESNDNMSQGTKRRRGNRHKTKESPLSDAMDSVLFLTMLVQGYPPGTTLEMLRERDEKEAEERSRQAAVAKVENWLEDRQRTQSKTSSELGWSS